MSVQPIAPASRRASQQVQLGLGGSNKDLNSTTVSANTGPMHPYANGVGAAAYRMGPQTGSNSPLPPIPGNPDQAMAGLDGIEGSEAYMYGGEARTGTYSQSNMGTGTMPRGVRNPYEREQMQAVHEQEEADKRPGFLALFRFWA